MCNRVCLVVVWFGKLPVWMPFFLKSCSRAAEIDWLIFSDAEISSAAPANVHFHPMSKSELESLISERFEEQWQVPYGYKLCDLKPAYGHIFEKWVQAYEFWGYTDLDILMGNPMKFLTRAGALEADVITASGRILVGHFTLLRNTERFRKLYQECGGWRERLRAEAYVVFDEADFSDHVKNEAVAGKLRLAEVPIVQEDCLIDWAGRSCFTILWSNGRVFDLLAFREFGYFHFIQTKSRRNIVPETTGLPGSRFFITGSGFRAPAGVTQWLQILCLLCVQFFRTIPWYCRRMLKPFIPAGLRAALVRRLHRTP